MLKISCRMISTRVNAHSFKASAGVCLTLALVRSVAILPFGAFAEENDAVVLEEPMMMDSAEEGGGIVPR